MLEIGAGTGLNLRHYPADCRLTLAEPDPHMRAHLAARCADAGSPAHCAAWPAEHLPVADHSFDCVVSTLVLCSVRDPARAIAEVSRVLRPQGRLLLIEHIRADTGWAKLTQRALAPLWRCCAGGCRLCRDPRPHLSAAGFLPAPELHCDALPGAPWFLRPALRGTLARR